MKGSTSKQTSTMSTERYCCWYWGRSAVAARSLIDVTRDDQNRLPTMIPVFVMKFRMRIWLLGMDTLSQMMSLGLGAWFTSMASCDSSICWINSE